MNLLPRLGDSLHASWNWTGIVMILRLSLYLIPTVSTHGQFSSTPHADDVIGQHEAGGKTGHAKHKGLLLSLLTGDKDSVPEDNNATFIAYSESWDDDPTKSNSSSSVQLSATNYSSSNYSVDKNNGSNTEFEIHLRNHNATTKTHKNSSAITKMELGTQTYVIILLSTVVLFAILFTMFGLFMKAEAHTKADQRFNGGLLSYDFKDHFAMSTTYSDLDS